MKPAETWVERVVTDWLFGSFFIHVVGKPSDPGSVTLESEAARKAINDTERLTRVPQVQDRGCMFIYPEGRVHGPGPVQRAGGTGAMEDLIDHHRGGKNLFIPKGIACANLGRGENDHGGGTHSVRRAVAGLLGAVLAMIGGKKAEASATHLAMHRPRKVLVNVGRPFIIDRLPTDPQERALFRQSLADEVMHRQVLASSLTLDSLVGELALVAKARGLPLRLEAASVESYVHDIIHRVRDAQNGAEQTWLNELAVDQDLFDPKKLRAMCQVMMRQLADNGWVDGQGMVAMDRLGSPDDMNEPAEPRRLHLKDPLTYWGRRQRQVGAYVPELKAIVEASRSSLAKEGGEGA